MLCENCKKNDATIHYKQIFNGLNTELHLCGKCASEMGLYDGMPKINISDFFSGLLGNMNQNEELMKKMKPGKADSEKCPKCGRSFSDFHKTGKAGCAECYDTFENKFEPLIKRLHGGSVHKGRVPAYAEEDALVNKEIDELKELLNKAVQEEKYEKAAELRDKIRSIENIKNERSANK